MYHTHTQPRALQRARFEGYDPKLVVVGSSCKHIVFEPVPVLLEPLASDGGSRHRQLLLVDTGWGRNHWQKALGVIEQVWLT